MVCDVGIKLGSFDVFKIDEDIEAFLRSLQLIKDLNFSFRFDHFVLFEDFLLEFVG